MVDLSYVAVVVPLHQEFRKVDLIKPCQVYSFLHLCKAVAIP